MTQEELEYYENTVISQIEKSDLPEKERLITFFLDFCSKKEKADLAKCIVWYENNIYDEEEKEFSILSTISHDIGGIVRKERGFSPRSSSYSTYVISQLN